MAGGPHGTDAHDLVSRDTEPHSLRERRGREEGRLRASGGVLEAEQTYSMRYAAVMVYTRYVE